jgi:hypothetical protein
VAVGGWGEGAVLVPGIVVSGLVKREFFFLLSLTLPRAPRAAAVRHPSQATQTDRLTGPTDCTGRRIERMRVMRWPFVGPRCEVEFWSNDGKPSRACHRHDTVMTPRKRRPGMHRSLEKNRRRRVSVFNVESRVERAQPTEQFRCMPSVRLVIGETGGTSAGWAVSFRKTNRFHRAVRRLGRWVAEDRLPETSCVSEVGAMVAESLGLWTVVLGEGTSPIGKDPGLELRQISFAGGVAN